MDDLVQLLFHQSIALGFSWGIAYAEASQLRRGHWLVSLIYVGALQAAAWWVLTRFTVGPPLVWLTYPAVIGLATVAITARWNAIAHACMTATASASVLFLAYVVAVTAQAHLGPVSVAFASVLVAMQAAALLLLVASSYEVLDVMCRLRWTRVCCPRPTTDYFPKVSLHVPAHNEPPDMVKETLDALAKLDYPNYEVIVIDDNTTDERLWRPVEAQCKALGFKFFHLENWPGFKSGALNYALTQTAPDAEVIGVVDSDYLVAPNFLRDCVGFLRNPDVAFVQTPQDYRDVPADDRYATACYHAYQYFFKVSMPSRNEHNGIIITGTMALIRKTVLQEVGGWDEWCITEDAELSLRILDRGYESVYLDVSYGRGLMPLNFEGLKKQRFRWAFGGMQILKAHWRSLMPWARWCDPAHRLTAGQRWDYLVGGLQWLNDPLAFGFTILLLLAAGVFVLGGPFVIPPLIGAVLVMPFLFIFIAVSRFLWVLRHRVGCTLGQAFSAFTILLGLAWVVALACLLGLVKSHGTFLRTPKEGTALNPWHAARTVSNEAVIAGLCLVAAVAAAWKASPTPAPAVMIGLLLWQALIYAAAPVGNLWSYRSEARGVRSTYATASSRTTGLRDASMIVDRSVACGPAAAKATIEPIGGWAYYFLAKVFLHLRGNIPFDLVANLAFAAWLLTPTPASLRRFRAIVWARRIVTATVAVLLVWRDSWLPPLRDAVGFVAIGGLPTAEFLIDFLVGSINFWLVGSLVVLVAATAAAHRYVRMTPVVAALFLIIGVQRFTTPKEAMDRVVRSFLTDEAKQVTAFPRQDDAEPAFDLVFLHVCSLSWDDLRDVGLENTPFLKQFDYVFTNFNSVTSHSTIAALRLLRSTCGQTSQDALYQRGNHECYTLDSLRGAGFQTWLALNHTGEYMGFKRDVQTWGHADAPLDIDDLPVSQYDFSGGPMRSDAAVLDRWLAERERSGAQRAALYYNTITLHIGSRRVEDQVVPRSNEDAYRNNAGILFDELGQFFSRLASSGRDTVVLLVPEHGAALRGTKLQPAGLREIPLPRITIVPVAVKLIGHRPPVGLRPPQVIATPTSYQSLAVLVAEFLNRSPFEEPTWAQGPPTVQMPETPFLAENEGVRVIKSGPEFFVKQGARNDHWIKLPSEIAM
jgi:cellulose synthase operon protein YhjU